MAHLQECGFLDEALDGDPVDWQGRSIRCDGSLLGRICARDQRSRRVVPELPAAMLHHPKPLVRRRVQECQAELAGDKGVSGATVP